jgi:peptide-methionine (S)-S-oxide reductase
MTQPAKSALARLLPRLGALALVTGVIGATALGLIPPSAAEDAKVIPAPVIDEPSGTSPVMTETATFAGGCFWGVQGVFQHVEGVTKAVSGYAGGQADTAHYQMVGSGETGHAESVQVTFDPHKVTYGQLLQIYFSVAHDPTQLNRQGPDSGTQYRSEIFATTPEQKKVAEAYIAQLNAAKVYKKPIVTKLGILEAFYPAEAYHQDYLTLHPNQPYIAYNDIPKVENLKKIFAQNYIEKPTLVSASKVTN